MDIGPQYSADDEYKAKARRHQSQYREEILKVGYQDYGNRLNRKAALEGNNFYLDCKGLLKEAMKRYPLDYSPLYFDMLRSEHIPLNIFIPLKLNIESNLLRNILNVLLNGVVETIQEMRIEWSPKPEENYLNDLTSFDTYIQYKDQNGERGGTGVEVKYTEKEYPYGEKERREFNKPDSIYNTLTNDIGMYRSQYLDELKKPLYKQLWRNHLLGESMIEDKKYNLKHFTSVVLYPMGNTHFSRVCREYEQFIIDNNQPRKFIHITFEEFIDVGKRLAKTEEALKWLNYLSKRYIVD